MKNIEKKDTHHLCYTRKGWAKKYARKFRTDKYCIVTIPRDTLHAQIHQHLIEIPAPTEDGARNALKQLELLKSVRLAQHCDAIETRLEIIATTFDRSDPETAAALREQKRIVSELKNKPP